MVDNINFSIENIANYKKKLENKCKEEYLIVPKFSFNTQAILSLYDTNYDGKISKSEFENISKDKYKKFVKELNNYNASNSENKSNLNRSLLETYLDKDNQITISELEGNSKKYSFMRKTLKEDRHLKDATQMNNADIEQELSTYGFSKSEILNLKKNNKLQETLVQTRKRLVLYDKNSDKVDWHIGTHYQGSGNICTLLAFIDTMTSSQLHELYSQKKDNNGQIYYEFIFPQDRESNKVTIVTEEEFKKGEITTFNNKGEPDVLLGLPIGDKDTTLIVMAFLKRFGSKVYHSGAKGADIQNAFKTNQETKFIKKSDLTPDDLKNLPPNSTIDCLNYADFFEKDLVTNGDDNYIYLKDDLKINLNKFKVEFPNGTTIEMNHSYSVRKYDEKTEELIITGNEFTSASELRLPIKYAKYFNTAIKEN